MIIFSVISVLLLITILAYTLKIIELQQKCQEDFYSKVEKVRTKLTLAISMNYLPVFVIKHLTTDHFLGPLHNK